MPIINPAQHQKPVVFKGEQCVRKFLDSLHDDVEKLKNVIKHPLAMNLTDEEKNTIKNATTCHISEDKFQKDDKIVADHSHLTSKFRGPAHNLCNLNLRIDPKKYKVPVFFHNLRGYDAHFIFQAVQPKIYGDIRVIPKNGEEYIFFTIGRMVFKDSYAFMQASLDSLIAALPREEMIHTRSFIKKGVRSIKNAYTTANDQPNIKSNSLKRKFDTAKNAKSKRPCKNTYEECQIDENDDEYNNESEDFIADIDSDISFDQQVNKGSYFPLPKSEPAKSLKKEFFHKHQLDDGDYRKHGVIHTILTEEEDQLTNARFDLLTRKGVYAYSYFTDFSKFEEAQLPTKAAFYDTLQKKEISDQDYAHAMKVWETFDCKNLWDYHDLYLLTDVLLLADVMVSFRKMCLQNYQLDPYHFYTSPGFAFEAALKMSKVELELIDNPDMHKFIEKGIRGGVSMISHRHAEVDDEHCLSYLDANNLYGWAMCQHLPTSNFKWMEDKECLHLNAIDDESEYGAILEVDLEYPKELHDSHSDYPLAPEKMNIQNSMLSNEQISMLEAIQRQNLIKNDTNFIGPINKLQNQLKNTKLVPNLHNKVHYIVHYRNLKQYLNLGLKISKIHRVLTFKQEPWLKTFIDFNTQKRALASNNFEKNFFKLLNNSVFGKTMENKRLHRILDIVDSKKKAEKLIALPTFKNVTIFREDLIAIERRKTSIKFDKPIYSGFSILDISKTLMYDFHYGYIKVKYPGTESQLCFTDTDSFLYRLKTKDVHRDMLENAHYFDFSDYPDTHSCFASVSSDKIKLIKSQNKKRIGCFKDELKGDHMEEFVGLRAKVYAFKSKNEETKKLKGIKKSVVSQEIRFEHYKKCLKKQVQFKAQMNVFRSHHHQVYSVCQNKTSLSCFDDKRWICDDGITTLPHGHFLTNKSH